MGFLDKAKQLAEQAQQKLDEAQKNFSQSGSPQAQPGEGSVKYDEHGRPIQEAAPEGAEAAAPPAPTPPPDPAAPSPPPDPASEGDSGGGQANASPDPFKPLQQ
jgi:hypothetical protein